MPEIIAVSKTFPIKDVLPLINHGHLHFGENKVQEATEKWENIKSDFNHLKLHMIGKLQTNKAKYAVSIFDYIHSLDNFKLAEKISNEQIKQDKKLKIFIQVNIGEENQKSGVQISNVEKLYKTCIHDLGLDVIGLMCLPPNNDDVSSYFLKMKNLKIHYNLDELSMGMSNDYIEASKQGSTFVRIGSNMFGERTKIF